MTPSDVVRRPRFGYVEVLDTAAATGASWMRRTPGLVLVLGVVTLPVIASVAPNLALALAVVLGTLSSELVERVRHRAGGTIGLAAGAFLLPCGLLLFGKLVLPIAGLLMVVVLTCAAGLAALFERVRSRRLGWALLVVGLVVEVAGRFVASYGHAWAETGIACGGARTAGFVLVLCAMARLASFGRAWAARA